MPQMRICFFQKHHLIVSTARYIPIFSAIKTAYEALNTQWIFQSGILKASTRLARNHTVSAIIALLKSLEQISALACCRLLGKKH